MPPPPHSRDRRRLRRLGRKAHQTITSDAFLDALEELRGDAGARRRIKADAKGYLRGKGVDIDNELEVEFSENSPWVCCVSYYYGHYRVTRCYTLY